MDKAIRAALGDDAGERHTQATRDDAIQSALAEYTHWRSLTRRFGEGTISEDVAAGQSTIHVIGGVWAAGDTMTIDPFLATETATVLSLARPGATPGYSSAAIAVTLTAPLAYAHYAGDLVQPATWGLTTVAGQDTYRLPWDWIEPEWTSLNLALGQRATVRKAPAYYDALFIITEMLSQVGPGGRRTMGYPSGSPWISLPLSAGGEVIPPSGTAELILRFSVSRPPMLTIIPAPTTVKTIDFWYQAMHSPASIPSADERACVCYACYCCMRSKAAQFGAELDWTEGGITESPSRAGAGKASDPFLDEWNRLIVNRPYACTG